VKRQAGSIALIFMLVLAASLLANAWLWRAKGEEHDARTAAETKFGEQRTATEQCNASIAGLEMAAEQRGRKAEANRAAAAARRKKADEDADKVLASPPAKPGDDCGSAKQRIGDWLRSRK
jgi:hypothetical protein